MYICCLGWWRYTLERAARVRAVAGERRLRSDSFHWFFQFYIPTTTASGFWTLHCSSTYWSRNTHCTYLYYLRTCTRHAPTTACLSRLHRTHPPAHLLVLPHLPDLDAHYYLCTCCTCTANLQYC